MSYITQRGETATHGVSGNFINKRDLKTLAKYKWSMKLQYYIPNIKK